MQSFLTQFGTRQYSGVWLLLILASTAALIWIAVRSRDGGKWWLRTNVVLFAFVVFPAVVVTLSEVFGSFFDALGFPGLLVGFFGLAAGALVTIGGYLLAAVCVLVGLGTVASKGASWRVRIASIAASLISCFFIVLYLYIASRPQHW